ncbi:MAG TPA: acetyl-CoA C-acetyltransferase [Candidatus Acidoferrales bacterium]|nr:acetyl-CoA C-acetyltransferase [Candidatus Acidoferrales bacterium]
MGTAYIIDAVRTPRGKGKANGATASVHPQELLAQALNGLRRTQFAAEDVEDVVAGCVQQVGEQGACIGRQAVLAAGWPDVVSGVSLNRFCGSGLQAVNFAAMGVASGMQDLVVGGGVESMSRVPMGSDGGGLDGKNQHLLELHPIVPQGISADLIATIFDVSRQQCDHFAYESQQNAKRAMTEQRYRSLVPVKDLEGKTLLDRDEFPRFETTEEGLGQLQPSFVAMGKFVPPDAADGLTLDQRAQKRYPDVDKLNHVHTAGNSSGIVDGASAVLLASERYVKERGLKPRAKIIATATAGAEPVIMLTAPVPATQRALKKAGMTINDIDLFEINEAFAVVPIKVMRDLNIPRDKVNVNGGAIALGHPLGATGGMLIGTILDELERLNKTTGLVTLCIGGGMGITTIVERV